MTIQELLAQVRKIAEFSDSAVRNYAETIDPDRWDELGRMTSMNLAARWQHAQDAKIIESLLQIIEEQHSALHVAQERLYGVSIAVTEQGQNINPTFYITEYLKYGDQVRTAIASTLEKLKAIK